MCDNKFQVPFFLFPLPSSSHFYHTNLYNWQLHFVVCLQVGTRLPKPFLFPCRSYSHLFGVPIYDKYRLVEFNCRPCTPSHMRPCEYYVADLSEEVTLLRYHIDGSFEKGLNEPTFSFWVVSRRNCG